MDKIIKVKVSNVCKKGAEPSGACDNPHVK
jgi:hypothetical protein